VATPIVSLGQMIITPDGPLAAAWMAAFYCTVRAVQDGRGLWLVGAGAATGLAALSKYTGLLLVPQIGILLLLDRRGRQLLRRPWPWLGLGLATAAFAPVLLWNQRHDWSSFAFQLGRLTHPARPSLLQLGSFVGQQALILSPLLLVVLCVADVLAVRRWRDPAFRTCAVFSLPLLGTCLLLSPLLWVKPNWPAPAWSAAVLAAAGLFLEAPRRLRAWAATALPVAVLSTVVLHLVPVWSALPMPARDDVTSGWPLLGARVGQELANLPPRSFVLGCSYWTASELAFYVPGRPFTYGRNALGDGPGLEYQVWSSPADVAGREGIVVLDQRDRGACLHLPQACSALTPLPPLTVHRGTEVVTTFELWRCRPIGPGN
jgi:4-amino-4-deoxy-L-arabinose transferase-like glycosyltransferase